MTRRQLVALAEKAGLRGCSRLTKSRLIAVLIAASRQESNELPSSYGRTRLTLMEVGPYLVYSYWEVTSEDVRDAMARLANNDSHTQWVLRFHDVTGAAAAGAPGHDSFDVKIALEAGNWYIHLWSASKSYFAELGLCSSSGQFIPVSRSNIVHVPAAGPPPENNRLRTEVNSVEEHAEDGPEPVDEPWDPPLEMNDASQPCAPAAPPHSAGKEEATAPGNSGQLPPQPSSVGQETLSSDSPGSFGLGGDAGKSRLDLSSTSSGRRTRLVRGSERALK